MVHDKLPSELEKVKVLSGRQIYTGEWRKTGEVG